jgi:hypothetical protein
MNISNVVWRSVFAVGAVFIVLLVASCARQPPSTAPDLAPTEIATSTPTAEPLDESGFRDLDPGALPEAVGPLGLGEAGLPDRADSIAELFNRLPSRLMGKERTIQSDATTPGEINASYGSTQPVGCGTVGIQAMNISTGDFYPQSWTAERVIAGLTTGADWSVEEFGHDGELFWVRWNTTCSTEGSSESDTIFITSWGKAGSPWVFSASAGDPEGRDELTAAFVAASS